MTSRTILIVTLYAAAVSVFAVAILSALDSLYSAHPITQLSANTRSDAEAAPPAPASASSSAPPARTHARWSAQFGEVA